MVLAMTMANPYPLLAQNVGASQSKSVQSRTLTGRVIDEEGNTMPGVNMEYRNIAGLTVPQMYILLAECSVRENKVDDAMGYLDQLRQNRLPADTYQPLKGSVSSVNGAIEKVKQISFSENLWTCWNFIQRKRWNVEQAWQTTLSHDYTSIGFGVRSLRPESGLWVFPYPTSVVGANPYIK